MCFFYLKKEIYTHIQTLIGIQMRWLKCGLFTQYSTTVCVLNGKIHKISLNMWFSLPNSLSNRKKDAIHTKMATAVSVHTLSHINKINNNVNFPFLALTHSVDVSYFSQRTEFSRYMRVCCALMCRYAAYFNCNFLVSYTFMVRISNSYVFTLQTVLWMICRSGFFFVT